MAKNHAAIVGIIRVPGKGWPIKCPSCGNIGWEKGSNADARKRARKHRIDMSGNR